MDAAVRWGKADASKEGLDEVAALAPTIAFAVGGTLLGCLLLAGRNRRRASLGQVCLGVLLAGAAAIAWGKRKEEMEAARHLAHHVHEVRDKRWLKKHPVAYG